MWSHRPGGADPVHAHSGSNRPMEPIELCLASQPAAPAAARAALVSALTGHVAGRVLADAQILISELVTNSVRHARGADDDVVHVRAALGHGMLRLEVDNAGIAGTVAPRMPSSDGGGGYGLHLVDRVADGWGVIRDERTCVWAELACPVSA